MGNASFGMTHTAPAQQGHIPQRYKAFTGMR
jgi:hypothetical protein